MEMNNLPFRSGRSDRHWLIRNTQAANLLENFIIAAVAAILVIRLYLHLTGYPQLGGGDLHIAHMLWGGLAMLAAIIIVLQFINQSAREWAAVIGGIGFGAFIDELGKFITSDNNYFYQPAVAAIYVIFIVLILAARRLNRPRLLSAGESLANAIEIIREGMLAGGLEEKDKVKARELLERSSPEEPLTRTLRNVIATTETLPHRHLNPFTRVRHFLAVFYAGLVAKRWFAWVIIVIFVTGGFASLGWVVLNLDWSWIVAASVIGGGLALWAILFFIRKPSLSWRVFRWSAATVIAAALTWMVTFNLQRAGSLDSFVDWMEFMTATVAGILILTGAVTMYRSRARAYQWFRRAMLISILIEQVFIFYEFQFIALASLIISLLLLVALRYMINQEESRSMPA